MARHQPRISQTEILGKSPLIVGVHKTPMPAMPTQLLPLGPALLSLHCEAQRPGLLILPRVLMGAGEVTYRPSQMLLSRFRRGLSVALPEGTTSCNIRSGSDGNLFGAGSFQSLHTVTANTGRAAHGGGWLSLALSSVSAPRPPFFPFLPCLGGGGPKWREFIAQGLEGELEDKVTARLITLDGAALAESS